MCTSLTLPLCRFDVPEEIDEIISIDCPDMPWGVSRTFTVQRSALMRSPVLAEFFTSLDYLPGCLTNLHFMDDPGVCFDAVQTYLENGPDCYPMLRLKVYITRLTTDADRFMVLIRLHKFAIKLKLVHLKNMAFEVIHDLEWEMSAECCPKIAKLVFALQSSYDSTIRAWILKHIGHFHKKLSKSNSWAALVPTLDPALGQHWASMNVSGVRVLSMIAEEATDEAVSEALTQLSTPAKNSAVSAVEGPPAHTSPTHSEASTQTDDFPLTEAPKESEPSTSYEPEVVKSDEFPLTEVPNESEPSASHEPEVMKSDEFPLTEAPKESEPSTSHEPMVEKTNDTTPKSKKHKRSKALMNSNSFIVSTHKEWVVTCTPTKRSRRSPTSTKSASPTTSRPEVEQPNAETSQAQDFQRLQPAITVSQYEGNTSATLEHDTVPAIEAGEQCIEDLREQQKQDDKEWEDDEEEVAIQEAIRSFGPTPRDDSKAREVLGLPELSKSVDATPRPYDKNAKARRVLGINDNGGGLIAGRKQTRMMKVKKSLTRFNDYLNP